MSFKNSGLRYVGNRPDSSAATPHSRHQCSPFPGCEKSTCAKSIGGSPLNDAASCSKLICTSSKVILGHHGCDFTERLKRVGRLTATFRLQDALACRSENRRVLKQGAVRGVDLLKEL